MATKMIPMELANLANKLREAKFAYYHDNPIMTDAEFDALESILKEQDPSNPVLSETGAPANLNSPWPTAFHVMPMTSLSKAMTIEEFEAWWEVNEVVEALISEKLDGLSLSITYENGQLVSGVVRGDGIKGDNITSNVLKMRGVPKKLRRKVTCSVRGEVLMTAEDLAKARIARPEKNYVNCRNTASGLAREKSGELAHLLGFRAYDVEGLDSLTTESKKFSWLAVLGGFDVSPGQVVLSVKEVKDLYEWYIAARRAKLDYDIDGLVIRVQNVKRFADAGLNSEGKPIMAIALKFPPLEVRTKINNIRWEQGDSGRLSPVAEVEPVKCDGATVRNVNLHNLDFLLQHEVTVGAEVLIRRAGDIIPQLVKVLKPGEAFWK